ncbi:MAG: peroxiredoxin [Culicoidibacterales bacterium]
MCNSNCGNNEEEIMYYQEARVGRVAPAFEMSAILADGSTGSVSLAENIASGKWTVLYFYPLDFTFVCPTEIKALSAQHAKFEELNTNVVAVSTDSTFSHAAWRNHPSLGAINHPMAADTNHVVAEAYGVLIPEEGIALRGLFIIDPKGILVHSTINSNDVGRNVDEVFRTLEAFQAVSEGKVVPCGWHPGDSLLSTK